MKALGKQAQRGRQRIAEEERRKKKREKEWKRLETMTPEEITAEIQADRERVERVGRHLKTLGIMSSMTGGVYSSNGELHNIAKKMKGSK